MNHAKLVQVATDQGTSFLNPEHTSFIEPQQGSSNRCVVHLVCGNKVAIAETAQGVAQKVNAAMV
ncbi:hypothetical protein [Blastochloris viridis]|uniref:Uncharacterized protein n=1 Tax=Blastochloris viridis TaxID=1079 RepID=A0A0H5B6U2_BLAVI|nr:hypothetical protein [Blastochloris viridis]ALK08816.1 hypothetical protein BVIR_1025 [Blastochloris viridis]BAR97885.1 hypothetical protein BV133_292 [Blastochloris viridis]CUU41477.1 hypothetical protein BVIRIDIS_04680 [Blastochloris viridis]